MHTAHLDTVNYKILLMKLFIKGEFHFNALNRSLGT